MRLDRGAPLEEPEAKRTWSVALLLPAILSAAVLLRFTGLSWGLRHPPHGDEQDFVGNTVAMVEAGDLDHRFYRYPAGFFYLLALPIRLLGPARWQGAEAYYVSRAVVSAFGVLNVLALYLVGRRLAGREAALLAAALLAVSPLDVQTSHQVRPDILIEGFFILSLLVFGSLGAPRGDLRAGALIGAATAVKFTGLLMVPYYLAARWLAGRRAFKGALVALSLAVVIPVACTPYALLQAERYAPGPRHQLRMYYKSEPLSRFGEHLLGYLGDFRTAMGLLACACALVGGWYCLRRDARAWGPRLLLPLATVLVMSTAVLRFPRLILPGAGVVLLLAAAPVADLARRRLPFSRLAAALLAALMLVEPAAASWRYVSSLTRRSAEDEALDWLEANAAPGARILETRPEANLGARPGCALGVDRTRFVFVDRTRPADRADLPLLVPEMDFVVTKERAGPTWASVIEPVFKPRGPGCGAALLIQRPLESARPRYEALDLSRATLTASDNAAALGALVDGRPDTRWAPGEPTPSAWVDITLPRGLHAGSLVVAYAERSDRLSLRVLGAESGRDFMPVRRMVEATPGFQRSLEPQRPGGPCSFERRYVLRDRRPLRALRLEWKASRPEPLSLCELGLSTLVGPDSPGWEDALSQSSRVPPALTVGLTLLAGSLVAGDWPQWRGPARDGIVPGLSPRAAWPAALSPAWKVKVGSGHSSPVVAGDRVFVFSREGEDEVVQALELPTGRRLWRQSYPAPYTMNPAATAHGKGPKSTPVVEGGRVCTLGISGILSCFEAATGRVLWRKEFAPEFRETSPLYGAAMSPVVDQGRLIAHVGGGGQGALTAFDPATGKVLWAWKGDGPGYSSPVVADLAGVRHVVTFSESHLLGVSVERGELLWKLPFTTSYVQNAVTPVIGGGLVIYTGLDHPVRAARLVRKGGSLALEPAWENAEVASYLSSPVLVGGRVCGLSHRRKGQFFCLDAATGKTLWLSEGRQGDNAALLAGGGLLYALTSEAELLIVDPAAASFRELRRYSVAGSPTWAHPVLLGEGVLVKDVETVALLRF